MPPVPRLKEATLLQLATLNYGAVCAGAFGFEDIISSAGPVITIVTLIFIPFLFSIAVSFVVEKLTPLLPVKDGSTYSR